MLLDTPGKAFWVAAGIVLVSGLFVPSHAQDATGHVHGTVTDATGAVMPGVTVVLTNKETGVKRMLVSDASGVYSAPRLQTGTYELVAEQAGFKKSAYPGISVGAGSNLDIKIVMEVGGATETVSVTGELPMVTTTSGERKTSLDLKFLDTLPLSGRDSNDMLRFVPSAVKAADHPFAGYRINGMRDTSNNYTLDGTDSNDAWNASANKLPPPDALEEFTVSTSYSAEYGHGGGAAVVALTKSGTNQFHGTVYDYFRSENLNANTFQRNATGLAKGEFKRHQLGFTAGGPVYLPKVYDGRNRSFYFVSYQALKTPAVAYLVGRGGLTQAELDGDFSKSLTLPLVSSAAARAANSPFAAFSGQTLTNLKPYLSQTALRWYKAYELPIVQNSGDYTFENAG
jgi:hypothetical protein